MASFLGSLLGGLSKGVETLARHNMAEESRDKERDWQSRLEERRAARAEALAKWQDSRVDARHTASMAHQEKLQADRLAAESQMREDEWTRRSVLEEAKSEAAGAQKQADRQYEQQKETVKYLRDRTDKLDDLVPQARIKNATEALLESGGADMTLNQEEINAMEAKLRLYKSVSEEDIKAAGKWMDYKVTVEFFEILAANKEDTFRTEVGPLLPDRESTWHGLSSNDAASFLESLN